MFEFIGVCFVLFLTFKIGKSVIFGAMRGTLFKAIDFAVYHGVPYDFAKKSIDNRVFLKSVINNLKLMDPNFSTLDVYEQYGMAIRTIYQGLEEEKNESMDNILYKIEDILLPQIDNVIAKGEKVYINDISFAYVLMLAASLTEKSVDLKSVKHIIERIFSEEIEHAIIENYYSVASNRADFMDVCRDLYPITAKEAKDSYGDYYERLNSHLVKSVEEMLNRSKDYDPRYSNYNEKYYLDI